MDYRTVLTRLATQSEVFTAATLADALGISARSLDYHLKHHGLPGPFFEPPDARRFWRPQALVPWVERQQRLAEEGLTLAEVCDRTGLSERRWRTMVKAGRAPQAAGRELGTGILKWWPEDIETALQQLSGGYRFPRRGVTARSRDADGRLAFSYHCNFYGMSANT